MAKSLRYQSAIQVDRKETYRYAEIQSKRVYRKENHPYLLRTGSRSFAHVCREPCPSTHEWQTVPEQGGVSRYYQANANRELGEPLKARQIITKYLREWSDIRNVKDNGFFGTTPFFISFISDPADLRAAQYNYLTSLCYSYMGDDAEAEKRISEATRLNRDLMLALSFQTQGFMTQE